jgi:hypothetical protein
MRRFEGTLHLVLDSHTLPRSGSLYDYSDARRASAPFAREVFADFEDKSFRWHIHCKAANVYIHPTLPFWYITRVRLHTDDCWWLTVTLVSNRWC